MPVASPELHRFLALTILDPPTHLKTGGEVPLVVALKNSSERPVRISTMGRRWASAVLLNEAGTTPVGSRGGFITAMATIADLQPDAASVLDARIAAVTLVSDPRAMDTERPLEPGVFQLQAYTHGRLTIAGRTWDGYLLSPQYRVQVTAPSPRRENNGR
ncbi:MAG: hypothetical protein HYX51_07100 [Chloroflexi bacterium]|nr:hypothetical protein [Chloroflexota bacterium]